MYSVIFTLLNAGISWTLLLAYVLSNRLLWVFVYIDTTWYMMHTVWFPFSGCILVLNTPDIIQVLICVDVCSDDKSSYYCTHSPSRECFCEFKNLVIYCTQLYSSHMSAAATNPVIYLLIQQRFWGCFFISETCWVRLVPLRKMF